MTDSSQTSKKAQYASLRNELSQLNENIIQLNSIIQKASSRLPDLENLGMLHSSLTISASRVLNETSVIDRVQQKQQAEKWQEENQKQQEQQAQQQQGQKQQQ
ncbi:hypothetical protein DM01DRAFT_350146 [Hesseltinella vesiculosa]|uniref:Uncharacterized protein n=1 Tax=Hesseltinella vesiculosa TaxID=101127 RepID=A0A1X2G9C8_9FUNG|nr:hypothetical protein DM01DRAFT_350146 [Hesseltinella vesiculosa]